MSWTSEKEIKAALAKIWESGKLPRALVEGREIFPIRITIKGPSADELAADISAARSWSAALFAASKKMRGGAGYALETRTMRHRTLGAVEMPSKAVIESAEDGAALIGAKRDIAALDRMCAEAEAKLPALIAFIAGDPLRALEEAPHWAAYIAICLMMLRTPRPAIYLREFSLPEADSKFIENHKKMVAILLDMVLPDDAVDKSASPGRGFERRYGFREAPLPVRIRLPLDCRAFPPKLSDVTLAAEEFAALDLPCREILVIENLATFLALPRKEARLLIWGQGYGFKNMENAQWMNERRILYWGDIDTHGFAILSEFRAHYPEARSVLMDEKTLRAGLSLCAKEEAQVQALPANLNEDEARLFEALQRDSFGPSLRLEQERVPLSAAIEEIDAAFKD